MQMSRLGGLIGWSQQLEEQQRQALKVFSEVIRQYMNHLQFIKNMNLDRMVEGRRLVSWKEFSFTLREYQYHSFHSLIFQISITSCCLNILLSCYIYFYCLFFIVYSTNFFLLKTTFLPSQGKVCIHSILPKPHLWKHIGVVAYTQ